MLVRIVLSIFLSVILSGCLPTQTPVSPKSQTSDEASTNDDDIDPEETEINKTAYWYDNGFESKTLTVDITNLRTVFIFGDDVNLFLSKDNNYQKNYCLYANFQPGSGTSPKQLRVKAIPSYTYNPTENTVTRYLRININTESGNDLCNLSTINSYQSDGQPNTTGFLPGTIANSVDAICSNCINIISSTDVKLYESRSGQNHIITNDIIKSDSLRLNVDVNSNSDNNQQSCSDSLCRSQGFDCCINSQCVNDAQPKFTRSEIASNYTPAVLAEFDLAEQLKLTDPNWYKSYPHFYYVCLEEVPDDNDGNTDGGPDDPTSDAVKRLNKNIQDFYCIEELKENTDIDPFHTDPMNLNLPQSSYKVCKLADDPVEEPNMHYQKVMMRLYENCGCSETTYNDMVAHCPKYTYKAISADQSEIFTLANIVQYMGDNSLQNLKEVTSLEDITGIQSIECIAPQIDPNDLPFQDLQVLVSSKTAPHRFFDENTNNGEDIEIIDPADLPIGAEGKQEGAEFKYLDNTNLFPDNGDWNMNSILGQMNVNLTKAIPAKIINIEFDKQYYIATIEGYYTPCPSCAKDSWFPSFSAHPVTNQGVGLRSIGNTTKRDAWGSNTTFGNYEDTIFGRACWLPPTMLPFSHSNGLTAKEQRKNRLTTQAAMYVNGYQRDWFGFNKGALIGSFDGVSWFAVGKGRIAKSTSTRLYLAINAPFADLANPNDHLVTVQEWDFMTTGAHYDYNETLSINHPAQNEAAQCQRSHRCETDTDCITQLGWEYVCADINNYKTNWPRFSVEGAKEIANDSRTGSILSLLNQEQLPPGASSKKCVYRGAGAPCKQNYTTITDEGLRKSVACAPNFYCADLDETEVFNREVSRFATALQNIPEPNNHLFGQEANILGRPKYYLANGSIPLSTLTDDIKTTITQNFQQTSPATNDVGLCRPGKRLPEVYASGTNGSRYWKPVDQHTAKDPEARTDFISQIGSCNSSFLSLMKATSCPVLDDDGNYTQFKNDFFTMTDSNLAEVLSKKANSQNACGLEAIDYTANLLPGADANTLSENSAFDRIEAKPLSSSHTITEPTLVRDACFRRAGSVCNTDLDCSPNYKHSDLVDILNPTFFGNAAEKKYWQENLVCGQGEDEPITINSPNFNTYNIRKNVCCREVGKGITMYTEKVPGVDETTNLDTRKLASIFPYDENRYSRYSILENDIDPNTGFSTLANPTADTSTIGSADPAVRNILSGKQWKVINETGSKTCCGGGWIRKFADGTNNWTINRLNIDVNNFRCLNFKSPLVNTNTPEYFGLTNAQNSQDSQNTCLDPTLAGSGCSQQEFGTVSAVVRKPAPHWDLNRVPLHSDPTLMDGSFSWSQNPYAFSYLLSADTDIQTWLDWDKEQDDAGRKHINVRLPSFITWPNSSSTLPLQDPVVAPGLQSTKESSDLRVTMESITTSQFDSGNPSSQCVEIYPDTNPSCNPSDPWCGITNPGYPIDTNTDFITACDNAAGGADCCMMYDRLNRILKISYKWSIVDDEDQYGDNKRSFFLEFDTPGRARWENKMIPGGVPSTDDNTPIFAGGEQKGTALDHRRAIEQMGNATYYLERLSKLELNGIPQVTYDPLYCSDNYQKIVPGIFKDEIKSINTFNAHPLTHEVDDDDLKPFKTDVTSVGHLEYESVNKSFITTSELLNHEPIFAANDFMCCKPLGSEIDLNTQGASACCSGFAMTPGSSNSNSNNGPAKCMLPPRTNLNVFFNKFVSGEGMSDDLDNPLVEEDFDEKTGAPLFSAQVINKLQSLAQEFCSTNQYTTGGAFGPYDAEPRGSMGISTTATPVFSIVDSINDNGVNIGDPAGFNTFNRGYKWNNNIYCLE